MDASIVFFANAEKANAASIRNKTMQIAQEKGFRCLDYSLLGQNAKMESAPLLLAAIGGDGTILKAVQPSIELNAPILGINNGRIGFLSEIRPDDFAQAIDEISAGRFSIEHRMMFSCSINGVYAASCLNDILLYRHSISGVAQIGVQINDSDAGAIFCDGIIASTPTGSTGYSISAGGPVVAPGLDVCIITPICPHSLCAKPIVASADSRLDFLMMCDGRLYADGQEIAQLKSGDRVCVSRAAISTRFIRFKERNLFQLIKEKLI